MAHIVLLRKGRSMTETKYKQGISMPAHDSAALAAQSTTHTPQTVHPSYRLAFQDMDFLLREDLRAVRFQLELLKPELALKENGIASTVVFYGSARIPSMEEAPGRVAAAQTSAAKAMALKMAELAPYYEEARMLAKRLSRLPQEDHERHFVVMSGGGPSIMEAANRGATEEGAPSVALNIVLPHEQAPNEYVTPGLSFLFHYFALRKMHFLMRARAVCIFPGGFGTFDELFEVLTLIQTKKIEPIPLIMFGRKFWSEVVNFQALADYGVISPDDINLFQIVETADEAWTILKKHYTLP
jgi:uncharacterized protein (TIGR00730 family)